MISRLTATAILLCLIGCNSGNGKAYNTDIAASKKNIIDLNHYDGTVYMTAASRNIGTLYEGETVEGVLSIRNNSDTTSIIKEVKGSCGCMTIKKLDTKQLKANEVMNIGYTINTSLKSGEEYFDVVIISTTGKYVIELIANIKSKN